MEIFYREKEFQTRKKNQKKWLCPLRKIFLLRPCYREDTYRKMVVPNFSELELRA